MNNLNIKHPKYEYTIFIRLQNGIDYTSGKYTSLEAVKYRLEQDARWNDRYHRKYYIDEDFWENEYREDEGRYYKILMRPVNDWEEYYEERIS